MQSSGRGLESAEGEMCLLLSSAALINTHQKQLEEGNILTFTSRSQSIMKKRQGRDWSRSRK